ncbi:hypothetical protein ACPPVO_16320 [Dactylosporangium sp. McL0621]|uniref:hypothetical protein n=1 Tax=Dactylosporangium sp. McL0621 TaxID=3415678 RepID=UPI003CE7C52C
MNDLDDMVRASLAAAADDDVHVERLLAGVRANGSRRRRRRRLIEVTGVVAAVAVVVAGAAVALRPAPDGAPATPSVLPTGRPVPDAVSPLQDPGVVGVAPVLHLTLASVPFPVDTVRYSDEVMPWPIDVADENLLVNGRNGEHVSVRVSTKETGAPKNPSETLTPEAVDVGGVPGQFVRHPGGAFPAGPASSVLTWRAGALYFRLSTSYPDPQQAVALALGVRLDRAHSCGPSFRLPASLTAGLTLQSCRLSFKQGRVNETASQFAGADHRQLSVQVNNAEDPGLQPSGMPALATDVVDGRPVWLIEGYKRATLSLGGAWIQVDGDDWEQVKRVAGAVEPLGFDAQQWPI